MYIEVSGGATIELNMGTMLPRFSGQREHSKRAEMSLGSKLKS